MSKPAVATPIINELHAEFLALLPRIETHACIQFRHIWCAAVRDDNIAECRALAWKWFLRLKERGKDAALFPAVFASFVVRAVRCGRRACGREKSCDVMNLHAQLRRGFKTEALSSSGPGTQRCSHSFGQRHQEAFAERLKDNTVTPPDEQAMFRLDFPAWLKSLSPRERRIVEAMCHDERTCDLAQRFGVSPGRISQLRREFAEDWQHYCEGDEPTEKARPTKSSC